MLSKEALERLDKEIELSLAVDRKSLSDKQKKLRRDIISEYMGDSPKK